MNGGLPHSDDSERAVLGAVLLEGRSIEVARKEVTALDFFLKAHQLLFARMLELADTGTPIDHITIIDALRRHNELEAVGGPEYVIGLTSEMPRGAKIAAYAARVRDASKARQVNEAIKRASRDAAEGNGNPTAVIERLIENLQAIQRPKVQAFTPPDHWRLLDASNAREWVCDELRWLIEKILARGTVSYVAADSQVGKTLLMIHAALMVARGERLFGTFPVNEADHVLYLALEDPPRRVKARLLDTDRTGNLVPPGKLTFYVAPGLRLNDCLCLDWLERFIEDGKFDVVFIDTFQKATPGLVSFDDKELAPILHRLSDLARRLNLSIVIVDHLAKPKDGRKRKELSLTDIKGSGGKGQNADTVILLDRTADDELVVSVSCKDSDKRLRFLLSVSPENVTDEPKFTYLSDLAGASSHAQERVEARREAILQAMSGKSWMSAQEIQTASTIDSEATMRRDLAQLCEQGSLKNNGKRGRWRRYRSILPDTAKGEMSDRTSPAEPDTSTAHSQSTLFEGKPYH